MAEHECKQEGRLGRMERELGDLNNRVWRGNGQASMMEKLATLEVTVRILCWLVGVTCVAVIGQIVSIVLSK